MENCERQYDVFISYRHSSGFYMANLIYSKLVYDGYSVFIDKTLKSGKYMDKIKDAIMKSRNYLLIMFPGDFSNRVADSDVLLQEINWALSVKGLNIVPVMCDGFKQDDEEIPEKIKELMENNGVEIHKDYSMDSDIERLRDVFLKNVAPVKMQSVAEDFYEMNLNDEGTRVAGVDMAFHAGAKWLQTGKKLEVIKRIAENKIPLRVIINTEDAAEAIAKHMRDEDASYMPFSATREKWKRWMEKYRGIIEVRECDIPLIHIHHGVLTEDIKTGASAGKVYIKYYAYNNTKLDEAFCHEISSYSPYYDVYSREFEFLWEKSKTIV